MLKILNKRFPVFIPNKIQWMIIIGIALFIYSFLAIFNPFNIAERTIYPMYIVGAWIALVTFLCTSFYFFILRKWVIFRLVREENWKLWHEIVWVVFLLILISIGDHIVSLYTVKAEFFIERGPWLSFGLSTYYTVMIGLFPSVLVLIYLESKEREFYQAMSAGLKPRTNENPVNNVSISIVSGTEELKFNSTALIYIKAEGNYLDFYLENETQVEKHVVRNTLSNIAEILQQEKTNCLRTHRSYLVNLDKIESVKGNSQGYVLTLKNHEGVIPVSRKSIPEFNRVMNDNN